MDRCKSVRPGGRPQDFDGKLSRAVLPPYSALQFANSVKTATFTAPFVLVNISFDNGIFLPDLDLWLDPGTKRSIAFVSHAHSDHTGYHAEVILSEITARLMAARLPGNRIEHALPFHRRFQFRDASITLLPAGHILGSAQIYVENGEGASLLYTGDFKLRPGKSAEAIA